MKNEPLQYMSKAPPITLKHLCREFDLDPYPLRQKLRQGLEHKQNQRWQWQPDDPQLTEAKAIARSMQTEGHKP